MNTEMNWDASEIRQLRSRLGWSQAEFARQMNCDLATVAAWEVGAALLAAPQKNQMMRIFHQAEANSDRMQRRPIAELIMKDRGLSQIHDLEVIETASVIINSEN